MAAGSYIIAMTGPGDTNEGLQRLVSALVEIDKALSAAERAGGAKRLRRTGQKQFRRGENGFENVYWGRKLQCGVSGKLQQQEQVLSAWDAEQLKYSGEKTRTVAWAMPAERYLLNMPISNPPGIPLVVPENEIGKETARQMTEYQKMGFFHRRNGRKRKDRGVDKWVRYSISWERVLPERILSIKNCLRECRSFRGSFRIQHGRSGTERQEGVEYHFVGEDRLREMQEAGRVIRSESV